MCYKQSKLSNITLKLFHPIPINNHHTYSLHKSHRTQQLHCTSGYNHYNTCTVLYGTDGITEGMTILLLVHILYKIWLLTLKSGTIIYSVNCTIEISIYGH
jgi:hypothetical protein